LTGRNETGRGAAAHAQAQAVTGTGFVGYELQFKKRAITHFHEHGSLLRYWNIFRSGMGVRRISGKPRLILTSFVLALSSISPFTPKYEL